MTGASEERPLIEISASRGWRALGLRELFQYRELLGVLVWRDIKVRYRQTLLGILWVAAQPLLTMVIFTVLFNRVANISPDRDVPYSVFVMAGLVPWTFFSTAVSNASNSLIGSSHLISKVYFPRMIIPAASVTSSLVDMAVMFVLVLLLAFRNGVGFGASLLFLPIVAIITAVFAFGAGLWLSSLNVEYRDVRVVIPFLLQIWMYATPVVYPARALPAKYRWIVDANPMTGVIEAFRGLLLGGPISLSALLYSTAVAAVVVVGGAYYFRRAERHFADVL